MAKRKKDKQRSIKHYTEKIKQHEPHWKMGMNSGALEG